MEGKNRRKKEDEMKIAGWIMFVIAVCGFLAPIVAAVMVEREENRK